MALTALFVHSGSFVFSPPSNAKQIAGPEEAAANRES
jgi:hypothetical protein